MAATPKPVRKEIKRQSNKSKKYLESIHGIEGSKKQIKSPDAKHVSAWRKEDVKKHFQKKRKEK